MSPLIRITLGSKSNLSPPLAYTTCHCQYHLLTPLDSFFSSVQVSSSQIHYFNMTESKQSNYTAQCRLKRLITKAKSCIVILMHSAKAWTWGNGRRTKQEGQWMNRSVKLTNAKLAKKVRRGKGGGCCWKWCTHCREAIQKCTAFMSLWWCEQLMDHRSYWLQTPFLGSLPPQIIIPKLEGTSAISILLEPVWSSG